MWEWMMTKAKKVAAKVRQPKKDHRISVQLDPELYEQMEGAAEALSETVSQFVRNSIRSRTANVQQAIQKIVGEKTRLAVNMEQAWAALDESETAPGANSPVVPPMLGNGQAILPPGTTRQIAPVNAVAPDTVPLKIAGAQVDQAADRITGARHPCKWFSKAVPHPFQAGQVEGSCHKQNGRPCFHAPMAASRCHLFDPFVRI